jgi:hypothetical protein
MLMSKIPLIYGAKQIPIKNPLDGVRNKLNKGKP